MKIKKKVKLKKRIFLLIALGIMVPLAFSSFKNISFAMPVLGVDKKGAEFYQITLGGNADHDASIGDILGPSFAAEVVPDIIEEILNTYLDLRAEGEEFIDTYRRVGIQPFKERAYA